MSPADPTAPVRILVTGAGGPAAIAVLRALEPDPSVTLVAADMDPWAAGLYLVPESDRVVVPAGAAPHFVDAVVDLCRRHRIDILVPTVDCELEPIALAAGRFAEVGVRLLAPPAPVLAVTLDKLALATACADVVRVPRTESASTTDPGTWSYPVIVKPRRGSGSRGVGLVASAEDLAGRGLGEDMLVQELLPGEEYSVDVLADPSGRVCAAVPRVRQRVDSGVSVAGYTVVDPELQAFAVRAVQALGLPFVSNVQIRRDRFGRPALLEINPRVPGSLALTVAAGVDMARLAVDVLRGRPMPATVPHRPVAMVRYLADHVVELDELVVGAHDARASADLVDVAPAVG
jgi:carbamoyl-phosphate synthase large subunit